MSLYFLHLRPENPEHRITLDTFVGLQGLSDLKYTNQIEFVSSSGEQVTKSGGHYLRWQVKEDVVIWFLWTEYEIMTVFDPLAMQKLREIGRELGVDTYIAGDVGEEY